MGGHLAPECWGRCIHCARFGHKSQVCRSRPPQHQGARPQPQEPVKKTEGKKSKNCKKKNKEKAKRIAELNELINSPDISESDSESDSNINEAVTRVQIQSPRAGPSSERNGRSNRYAAETTDDEVIQTLNRTKIASVNKVKKTKSKGMSHSDGLISNRLDFRSAKTERLLLDSGAQVNIVGEQLARDAN